MAAVASCGSASIHEASCSAPTPSERVSKHAARGANARPALESSTAAHTPSRPTTTLSRPQPSKRSRPFTDKAQSPPDAVAARASISRWPHS